MEQTNAHARPSGIPRLSRLPVPQPRASSLRTSSSRDNLHQQSPPPQTRIGGGNTRLRTTPSREQLSTSHHLPKSRTAASIPRRELSPSNQNTSTPRILPKTSNHALFAKSTKANLPDPDSVRPGLAEEEHLQEISQEYSTRSLSRKHRPSLSERTMETLQNIPPSPALRKRHSNFFNPESPVQSSSRPSSKDSLMGPPFRSFSSRPTSSSSADKHIPMDIRASSASTLQQPQHSVPLLTPVKRSSTVRSIPTPNSIHKAGSLGPSATKIAPLDFRSPSRERSPSPAKSKPTTNIKSGSKTFGGRPLKSRPSVQGLFRKPSDAEFGQTSEVEVLDLVPEKPAKVTRVPKGSNVSSISPTENVQQTTPRKSSSALRDQIAKAKAAKRAAASTQQPSSISPNNENEVPVVPVETFDFGLNDDPFNQGIIPGGGKGLLRKRIDAARTDGRLNIAAMGFKEIPEEVMCMYDSTGAQDGSWAETVDLTRFVAADNEIEEIANHVFPDIDPKELMEDEDAKGNQFGGLEALDLHGNILTNLPLGLRRLELLTSLNLSNNKLTNDSFGVISQIISLRDLKIAGNSLTGSLCESITELHNLETLDVQRNALTSLPDTLADLVRLRVLNIAENRFATLPFEIMRQLPLTELLAAKNVLSGVLIADDVDELPQLQVLDVTCNALKEISSSKLVLPVLHQLNCSSNRLTNLPDMSSWISLLILTAEDNNISILPEGFVNLPKVRNVDFSGNNLKNLDDRIGGMDSLHVLRISGNPFREKKLSGMTTEELKRIFKLRMEPEEQFDDKEKELDDGAFYSAQASPTSPKSAAWHVKAGGVLDRSNNLSHSLNPVTAAHVASVNVIRDLQLHHNKFKEIPLSIAFFAGTLTTLSMAHNELNSDAFLRDELELPCLKDLNLSSNTFNSLQPLIQHLRAPLLEKLDISFNRLTSLPALKAHFPNLSALHASNNTIRELNPESVRGLKLLDCSSNEISSLNARIGLLLDLQMLDVKGNRFRVPKYTILDKGTEATLAWLRDRIPAGSGSSSPASVE